MVKRRPLDEGPLPVHEGRALVGQVEVLRLEGPDGQQLPEDLVGGRPSREAHLCEEHEVHARLAIELEVQEDVMPETHGSKVRARLHEAPMLREDRVDEQEVPVLEELEVRVTDQLEDPEGPVAAEASRIFSINVPHPLALGLALALGELEDLLRTMTPPLLLWSRLPVDGRSQVTRGRRRPEGLGAPAGPRRACTR